MIRSSTFFDQGLYYYFKMTQEFCELGAVYIAHGYCFQCLFFSKFAIFKISQFIEKQVVFVVYRSNNIYPLGWCEMYGHKLAAPKIEVRKKAKSKR